MNISGPAAVAKPEMLFYAPGDLTVTSVFMNSNIVMKTSSDDANVLIQNSEENGADCKVYLYLNDTEKCVYESDNIPAGYKIEYAPLSQELGTGIHDCTGKIVLLNPDGTEKSSISMPVTITILK